MAEATTHLDASIWSDETDSPEAIREHIRQTRANMSEIVDAIQAKLSPERLTHEAKEMVKDATIRKVENMAHMATHKAETWRAQVVETVKQNPIPAALIGIGLGWLLIESARSSSEEEHAYSQRYDMPSRVGTYYSEQQPFMTKAQTAISENMSNIQDKASEMTQNVQERMGEVAENVQMKASEMAGNIQAKASEVTSNIQAKASEQADYLSQQAQYQMERAKRTVQTTLEENPLAVGAAAVAAGAAIGLMLPITQKEDELMGETRDRLLHQAQEAAKETLKKVEHGAEEAYRVVTEGTQTEADREEISESFNG